MLNKIYFKLNEIEVRSFKELQDNNKIPLLNYIFLIIKGIFSLTESLIRNISGPFGFLIRRFYYKLVFKKMGDDVLIDTGVIFNGAHNVSCGNRVWIDSYTLISMPISEIEIGNNIHIHSHIYMGGREKITINDNAGISSGSKLFTGGMKIVDREKTLFHPLIKDIDPETINSGPIVVGENSMILSNCVISPNTNIGKGSIVLSGSFLTKSTEPYSIFAGVPASQIGNR
tara:strand:- start:474 stop:1160 length:687 start_codon:yes stop_codon:yes gene_type:complete